MLIRLRTNLVTSHDPLKQGFSDKTVILIQNKISGMRMRSVT